MRATGLNTFGYRKQIKEWLDLSMLKHTPISLLIMSRAFVLNLSPENRQLRYEESLQSSISSMDVDVVNEVIVQRCVAGTVFIFYDCFSTLCTFVYASERFQYVCLRYPVLRPRRLTLLR
jgi:hypothetical protein